MTPEQDEAWEIGSIVEELRTRAMVDLLQLMAAVREMRKTMDNEEIVLIIPEKYRELAFFNGLNKAMRGLYGALKAIETPKRKVKT